MQGIPCLALSLLPRPALQGHAVHLVMIHKKFIPFSTGELIN